MNVFMHFSIDQQQTLLLLLLPHRLGGFSSEIMRLSEPLKSQYALVGCMAVFIAKNSFFPSFDSDLCRHSISVMLGSDLDADVSRVLSINITFSLAGA